jgi:hypothetical protein
MQRFHVDGNEAIFLVDITVYLISACSPDIQQLNIFFTKHEDYFSVAE